MAEKLLAQKVEGTVTALIYSSNSQIFAYGTVFGSIFIRQIVPGEEPTSDISFDEDDFDFDNRYYPGTQLLLTCKANNDSIRSLKWLDDVTLISTDSAGGISISQIVDAETIEECAENVIEQQQQQQTSSLENEKAGTGAEHDNIPDQRLTRDDPISKCRFEVITMKQRLCKNPISHLEIFVYLEHLYLAAGDDEGYVHILKVCNDYKDLKVLQTLGDAGDYITGIVWSELQSRMYASSADGTLYCYEIKQEKGEVAKDKRYKGKDRGRGRGRDTDIDLIDTAEPAPVQKRGRNRPKHPVFKLHDNSSPEEFSLTCMQIDPNERYLYCGTSEGHVLMYAATNIALPCGKVKTSSESIESMIRLYRNYFLLGSNDGLVHLVCMHPTMYYGIFCSEFKGTVAIMEMSEDKSLVTIAEHFSDVFYMMDAQWVHEIVEKQGVSVHNSEDEEEEEGENNDEDSTGTSGSSSEEICLLTIGEAHKYVRAPSISGSELSEEVNIPKPREADAAGKEASEEDQGSLEKVLEAPLPSNGLPKIESSTTDSDIARFFANIKPSTAEPTLKGTITHSTYDKNKVKAKKQAFFADLK